MKRASFLGRYTITETQTSYSASSLCTFTARYKLRGLPEEDTRWTCSRGLNRETWSTRVDCSSRLPISLGIIDSCLVMTPYSTVGFVVRARFSALQFTMACHCFISTQWDEIPSFSIADGIKKSGAAWVDWQWLLRSELFTVWSRMAVTLEQATIEEEIEFYTLRLRNLIKNNKHRNLM